jgi:hypothetical protein
MGQILGLGITHYPGLSAQGNLSRRTSSWTDATTKPLCAGDWETWRDTTLDQAEDRGHHELLNWFCLAGAMAELKRKPDEAEFLESWITNSNKVFAVFRPPT